jgi:phosphoribosylformylglycinamidine synthase
MYFYLIEYWNTNYQILAFPGGFSYGDDTGSGKAYANKVRNHLSKDLEEFVKQKKLVIGICNGFQILCEAGLLPGVLLRNEMQRFICENLFINTPTNESFITNQLEVNKPYLIPIAHAEGRYFDSPENTTILEKNNQILFQYCDNEGKISEQSNPNGSINKIAGICNINRNVFGMMPHPERAVDPVVRNNDGKGIFESILENVLKTAN